MNRRNLLQALPAVAVLPAVAIAPAAALAKTETPIERAYREIIRLRDRMNNDDALTENQVDRVSDEMLVIANGIVDMPSQGPMDFIYKMMGHTLNGDHDIGDCPSRDELWAEARALVG